MNGRHGRLLRFLGSEGAARLRSGTALIVGCGALGSAAASYLARAGIGRLRLVDFDVVHETNLGDQALFLERHSSALTPKVEAAAEQLTAINPHVKVEPIVAMFDSERALDDTRDVDVIVDGADNLETKYLINDVSVFTQTPWIYGACVGGQGSVLAVVPGQTPCLRCIWPVPPPFAGGGSCSSLGLLPTTPAFVAALQVTQALKILVGRADEVAAGPLFLDVMEGSIRNFAREADARRQDECPSCGQRRFAYLEGGAAIADGGHWSPAFGI